MQPLSTEPYKGVRDFYPEDKALQTALFAIVRDTLSRFGYTEYDASPLERAELYESKTSEEIVNEQTYTFTDRGERSVTLRPEMTPTLARMIAGRRRELPLPARWFSIGNRFRYERPQRGRLREFFQVDVDLVGAPEGEADLEVVLLAREILRAFGARDESFLIRVNSRALLTAACREAGLSEEEHAPYLRLLDKKARLSEEEFARAGKDILGERDDPLTCIAGAETGAVKDERERIRGFVDELKRRGAGNVVYDPTLTRGFDYYTGVVFEIFDTSPENPRALFGGGRYDHLIQGLFGGDEVPAVGFAFGDVTLTDFLSSHDLLPEVDFAPHLYLATPESADIPRAQEYARELREEGLSVWVNITEKKLGDQFKDAERRGVIHAIVYGKNEVSKRRVTIKNLRTGAETEVEKREIVSVLESGV